MSKDLSFKCNIQINLKTPGGKRKGGQSFYLSKQCIYLCMEVLKIDRTKLFTQSEYAKKLGVSRSRINHMVRDKLLNVIEIKGAKLIYAE